MSINTAFSSSKEANAMTSDESNAKWHQKLKEFKDNAEDRTTFGGKRFLGINKNGNEVWVSYELDKDTKEIKISSTHNLESLQNNEAQLAPRRVTVGLNKQSPDNLMRPSTAKDVGKVTDNTLRYLIQLIDMADCGIGKVNGKCSTQLFMYISNAIYEGGVDETKGECRWSDILSTWDLPSGQYFTVYG
mgnify:CR=1 FL=1|tara:strand:+ start:1200 stop:1766 length:567 start_codon:yes stop_codon:yes gene_type:complete